MFDPTIFDNLKVVAEGAVYDLDLQGEILITNRIDEIDLAKLSRYYAIMFRKANKGEQSVHGELRIYASVHDLSAEIMEKDDSSLGCFIEVVFVMNIQHPDKSCEAINLALLDVWGSRPSISQTISFDYNPNHSIEWRDTVILKFERKIGEAQVDDLSVIVNYMLESIDRLNEIL